MESPVPYIAVDWGTTNRRVYHLASDGTVISTFRDDRGVLHMPAGGYADEIAALRRRFGALPVIAAGMVGSTRGWIDTPYIDAPADPAALAAGCGEAPLEAVAIVPGIALRGGSRTSGAGAEYARADVMRGEEVQVFGAIANGSAGPDALFCQPGTHNKWIVTEGGRIVSFATALTGELFALLRGHGILAGMLDGPVSDNAAFRAGLARGMGAHDLTVALFEVRAGVLLGTIAADDAASFASGILIGADVGGRDDLRGRTVHLLAGEPLAGLYAAAIETGGGRPCVVDSHAAFAAGIHAIWSKRS